MKLLSNSTIFNDITYVAYDYESMERCLPSCLEIFYDSTISNAKFPPDTENAYNYLMTGLSKNLPAKYIEWETMLGKKWKNCA